MKVLLTQFVKKLGKEGDIIEVADGFAVNSLLPQKKAIQATPQIINEYTMKQKAAQQKDEKLERQTKGYLNKLSGARVEIKEKLNSKNSLYHSIGSKEVIRAVHDQYSINITNNLFVKKCSLKDAGEHQVPLEAYGQKINITVAIVAA